MAAPDNQTIIQLRAKRDELQDAIVYLESKLAEARADLIHVSAVLRLFEIGPDATQQFPAHVNLSRVFSAGELFAHAKAALEEAGQLMTTREIGAYILRVKRWDTADPILHQGVTHRLMYMLSKAKRCSKIASPGYKKGVRVWMLQTAPTAAAASPKSI